MKISIASWNTMGSTWRFINTSPLGTATRKIYLKRVLKYLLELKNIDVFCLQELPEDLNETIVKKYFPKFNFIKSKLEDTEIGVGFLCRLPIISHGEVVLNRYENNYIKGIRRSTCLWIDVTAGEKKIRIYNCKFQIRGTGIQKRIELIRTVLEHSKNIDYPIIICGDMNTTIPKESWQRKLTQWVHKNSKKDLYIDNKYYIKDERYIFFEEAERYGFKEVCDMEKSTWFLPYTNIELFDLKLDWFMVHNIKKYDYKFGPCITDHKPILVNLEL